MNAKVYHPNQVGAGTICDSETAITISATSIWNPALHSMRELINNLAHSIACRSYRPHPAGGCHQCILEAV